MHNSYSSLRTLLRMFHYLSQMELAISGKSAGAAVILWACCRCHQKSKSHVPKNKHCFPFACECGYELGNFTDSFDKQSDELSIGKVNRCRFLQPKHALNIQPKSIFICTIFTVKGTLCSYIRFSATALRTIIHITISKYSMIP